MPTLRIHKFLAHCGVGSRRTCENLIKNKQVTVNGVVAVIGQQIDPATDTIELDGKQLQKEISITYILHKPKGVVCSMAHSKTMPRVVDFIRENRRIYPIGRLDINSTGLILLSNDGDLTHALTHPTHKVPKTYQVKVSGRVKKKTKERLARGIMLENKQTAPAKVRIKRIGAKNSRLEIEIKEGRKNQIREMCRAMGHPVIELKRVQVGPLRMGKLQPGEYRQLTQTEISNLKGAAQKGGKRWIKKKVRKKSPKDRKSEIEK